MPSVALVPHPEPRLASARKALKKLLHESQEAGDGLLDLLVQGSSRAIFVVDADRNILLFNDRAEQITGFSRDEVVGRHCLTGFRCTHCLEACKVFDRGSIDGVTLDLFCKDGSTVRVEKNASVLRNRAGEIIGAVEVFRELGSADGRADDSAMRSSDRERVWSGLDLLLSSLGRGALLLDAEFHVRRASGAFADIVGEPLENLIGRPAAELFGEGLFADHGPFRAGLLRGQRREGWRATVNAVDGSRLPVSVTGSPFDGGDFCGEPGTETPRFLLMVRPETRGELGDADADSGEPLVFEGMVARSQAMRRVFHLIEHLRAVDATVLITGESGTGKELVARAIHARSTRANRPFVGVNCGALPPDLLEAELFGHTRGAFTGAVRDRAGRCEVAEDGTLFLDEIGDLPLPLQVKLLRVLQERTFERVGENRTRPFRARVVAATHQDLSRAVAEKRFREDLFYRLNVVPLGLPPLRERREDLDLLIFHLLDKIGQRRSRSLRLSPGGMRALLAHDWPGNVRQLENALEYATAVCDGQTIHLEDLPPEIRAQETAPLHAPTPLAESTARAHAADPSAERPLSAAYPSAEAVRAALERTRYRKAEAAKLLGISRTTLWRRMRQLEAN